MKKLNTILLVDDNDRDNFYHQIIIEEAGIADNIVTMQYAEEALEYLTKTNEPTINLIFLDINMPRMDGFQFLEAYSKLPDTKKADIIIIMLTTSLNPADEDRAIKYQEVAGFQNKPLTKTMLRQIVTTHFAC